VKKNKKANKRQYNIKKNRETNALFFGVMSFLSAYVFVVPDKSGIIGQVFSNTLFKIFGTAVYILPFIFLWFFIISFKQSIKIRGRAAFIQSIFCMLSVSVLLEFVRYIFKLEVAGGWLGVNLYSFFKKLFGSRLGFAVIVLVVLLSFAKFLRLSVFYFLCNFWNNLKVDMKRCERKQNIDNITNLFLNSSFNEGANLTPNIVNNNELKEKNKRKGVIFREFIKQSAVDSKEFDYKLPPADLLKNDNDSNSIIDENELLKRAELLRTTLADFDIVAEVKDIIPGPVITRYDLVLAPGTKIQTVSNIIDNISLTMRTASIRIVSIPEKSVVGIEVPNHLSVIVGLRGILENDIFMNSHSLLSLALGKTTDGMGYVTNLASMPHLLIAGATGSGKSVSIHTIILSILYKARPDEVKFLLIDPKRVEMSIYGSIPHLYNPCTSASDADIITNPKEVANVLKNLVFVMEKRYEKFAKAMVRNIEDYNDKMLEINGEKEFYIVVIIDELADLMLVVKKEIENYIQRLAQMARAVGIHLIFATQRPSVNVITGIIKANFPARLSFQTTSKIDSRVILDMVGAESLMGKGDMLFLPPGEARPVRLQGAFVSLKETEKIISFINEQKFPRIYKPLRIEEKCGFNLSKEKVTNDLISALKLINERRRISQDLLKANFGGSAKATNILSILETKGFISKPEGTNKWRIDFDKITQYLNNMESKIEK
jgi:S-DNA-T family DNA segregation ATPase FtsK/SpoIIIE